ncbi:gastrin/cholecystokinin type B receptor [Drosophila rhopaloa]|uniref:G-protein coupled receptors family 1 profile domain-containing protein n=1 Tax=Drosophila rhopaloa TaxID=1041015 RepID=A0ABM5JGG7_DRORH|nr:gastrin/cholecystokinin type B receptor [Drosophila rhopaloa]
MALLHYTFDQLERYLEWALAEHGEVTPTSTALFPKYPPYPGVFVEDLSQLNRFKRNSFTAVVGTLFLLAFTGNLCALVVNSRRKLRPFFRACLISLACSDLASTVFCTVSYMAQFHGKYLQLWTIGGFMCKFVPFITTTSVLSGSLTLVAIALDRYLAVMRPVLGFWNPDIRFSCMSMLLIWACSIGSSGPLLGIYEYKEIFLLEESDTSENSEEITAAVPEELVVTELEMAHMCVAGDHDVGLYYVILFTLIFLPCIVSFLWLNATIARQLWLRRHFHQEQQVQQQEPKEGQFKSMGNGGDLLMPSTLVSAMGVALPFALEKTSLPPKNPVKDPGKKTTAVALAREARHRKMVVVVILMMAVFICLRLPAWVFLIMRLFGSYSEPIDWLLYFSFGILNLFSCALNPIFYTFLTQTIRTVSLVKQKVRGFFGCASGEVQESMPTDHVDKSRCCCGLRPPTFKWICHPARNMAAPTGIRDAEQPDPHSDQVQPDPSSLRRFLSFNREVFTIYKQCDDSSSASIESSA